MRHISLPLVLLAISFTLCVSPALAQVDMEETVADAPPPQLSDNAILHVFITANQGEIVTSRPLMDQLTDSEVRAFATRMVDTHTEVIQQAQALAEGSDLTPAMNLVSASMADMTQGIADKLRALSGSEIDRKYIEHQVVLHGHTLSMLDHVLIPSADDAELEALLSSARPTIQEHLVRAQQLHHRLAGPELTNATE